MTRKPEGEFILEFKVIINKMVQKLQKKEYGGLKMAFL